MITEGQQAYINDLKVNAITLKNLGTGVLQVVNDVIGIVPSGATGNVLTQGATSAEWTNIGAFQQSAATSGTLTANYFYLFTNGGTFTVPLMNAGQKVTISALSNIVNLNFAGTSFIVNSWTGASPTSFSFVWTTVELTCAANGGSGCNWLISRVAQTNPSATFQLNGSKVSAISKLTDVPDTSVTLLAANQVLKYDGTNWINTNYSIDQISNSSVLANSSNVGISVPIPGQYLYYNGTQWANKPPIFYTDIIAVNGTNFTPGLGYIYNAGNCTAIMGATGLSDVGRRILITTSNNTNCTINFPNGIFFRGQSNFNMYSSVGSIEFYVASSNQYDIISCTGNHTDGSGNPLFVQFLYSLGDCTITSATAGELLGFNGTRWVNTKNYKYIHINSSGSLNTGYYIQQNGQTPDANAGAFLMSAGAVGALYISLDTAPGTGSSRLFSIYLNGVDTSQSILIADTNTTGFVTTLLLTSQNDKISVRHSIPSGSPAASGACGYLQYY